MGTVTTGQATNDLRLGNCFASLLTQRAQQATDIMD